MLPRMSARSGPDPNFPPIGPYGAAQPLRGSDGHEALAAPSATPDPRVVWNQSGEMTAAAWR